MNRFITKSLMRQMIVLYVSGAMVAIGLVAAINLGYAKQTLKEAAFRQLTSVKEIKKNQVLDYLEARFNDLEILSKSGDTPYAFEKLKQYHDSSGASPTSPYDVNSAKYKQLYSEIDPFFRKYLNTYGYEDMFFICSAHGHVMYTVKKQSDLGVNIKEGDKSGLHTLWSIVTKEKEPTIVDFSLYAPNNKKPAIFIGAPVLDEDGGISAVLALQLSTSQINSIMQKKTGMGKTGETYLVGQDFFMRSDDENSAGSTILSRQIRNSSVELGLQGQSGEQIITDTQRGQSLSSFDHIGINRKFNAEFDWVIIAEISMAEAFAPIKDLSSKIIWIIILLIFLSSIAGYFIARSISKPMVRLSEIFTRIAQGDLTITMEPSKRQDEVGRLTNSAVHMLETLRSQVTHIKKGANSLAVAISEISTTATQLATSSSETSTTIAEVATTVEEIRHTAHLSNDKAENVAREAARASEISLEGKKASLDAIEGIKKINEEMEYVAESIIQLSEQTQNIGEIIEAVNDFTDQSNLLSVNAAIEAAKAGEYGKGFSVVAQEVKNLAEQSKEATRQVKSILNKIQKASSSAVMATERGSKAVATGLSLSDQAGKTIDSLEITVAEASQASSQISASSHQQLAGMDQVVLAMENIKEATSQSMDGAKQLESATRDLDELGHSLKELAERFTV